MKPVTWRELIIEAAKIKDLDEIATLSVVHEKYGGELVEEFRAGVCINCHSGRMRLEVPAHYRLCNACDAADKIAAAESEE